MFYTYVLLSQDEDDAKARLPNPNQNPLQQLLRRPILILSL
jgi:hypothetical protein